MGQTDPQVKFLARGRGYQVYLKANEAVLGLKGGNETIVLRLQFAGAEPNANAVGYDSLPARSHYFIGNDPRGWRANVPHFAAVRVEGIYPGIDLVYYSNSQGQFEYDFVVKPGGDPIAIRLGIHGADTLRISDNGDLVLSFSSFSEGDLRLPRPVVYQEPGDAEQAQVPPARSGLLREGREVPCEYLLLADNEVGFLLGPYDPTQTLVIDPVLVYSTYLGGSSYEAAFGVERDAAGNIYVAGTTNSANFPITAGVFDEKGSAGEDVFITKLTPDGSALVYSTYLGGSGTGNGVENATAIAVDASGNAHVTGFTLATDFPTTPGAFQLARAGGFDAFVTKLNASGSALVYSSYLGGTLVDRGRTIRVDTGGNAYVVGQTSSADFPTVGGGFDVSLSGSDGFLTKVNPDGTALVYSTFIGGSSGDLAIDVNVDSAGNAYVTGQTLSSDFPTTTGAFDRICGTDGLCNSTPGSLFSDLFVAKFNAAGSDLVYSTYLGGSTGDIEVYVAVDASGNAYLTGTTQSADFPTTPGVIQPLLAAGPEFSTDVFIAKLNPEGSELLYSTYLGGAGDERGLDIEVDTAGNAYVAGQTSSPNFPTADAVQLALNGIGDAFVSKINATATELLFSSFLGGGDTEFASGLFVDTNGDVIVAGGTTSSDFPTASPLQNQSGGSQDVFISKIGQFPSPLPTLAMLLSPSSVSNTAQGLRLTLFGSDFVPDSVVRWNGNDRATTYVNSTRLAASIPITDVMGKGTAQVTVFNPAPGGGLSNALQFTYSSSLNLNPVPEVSAIAWDNEVRTADTLQLSVVGMNFVPGAIVRWDGTAMATRFVADTNLTVLIPARWLALSSTAKLVVVNPEPGGGASNEISLTIHSRHFPWSPRGYTTPNPNTRKIRREIQR